jgi:GH24 family phage-related lysozyme (muramidase)
MKISDAGLELIIRFEGLRLEAYLDPVGIWTIGCGHTGPEVRRGLKISRPRAMQLLREDVREAEEAVTRLVQRPLNQAQFDALVSFAFNAGGGALAQSTLLRRLNAGDRAAAQREFAKWVKGTIGGRKVTLPGLVRRRAAEAKMFGAEPTIHDVTRWLNENERAWATRYDTLVDAGQQASPEAKQLHERMRRQRKAIWRLAQPKEKGGDGRGWHFRHRLERYRSLKARTT